ncbi:MAG TPA: STN domain-containing protein, partial [Paludibacter sp.]|nr:STN domain-containing protein [Paludibacter sp.]
MGNKVLKHDLIPLPVMTRLVVLLRLIVVLYLIFVSFNVSAQDIKLTLNVNQKSLAYVLDAIEAKTGYSYLVRSNDVDLNGIVSINVVNKSLSEVLAQLFEKTHVNYEIKGHNISIFKPLIDNES